MMRLSSNRKCDFGRMHWKLQFLSVTVTNLLAALQFLVDPVTGALLFSPSSSEHTNVRISQPGVTLL